MNDKTLMIIDGNSIIYRAFYGIRELTTRDGIFTNGVYGFISILLKYLEEIKPEYICVAFDVSKKTFRNDMFEGYKAHRKAMPDELRSQLPILKEVLKAMNIAILEAAGYEADDIIGTVSSICEAQRINCCVITGDKDDLQLASKSTKIYLTTTRMGNTTTDIYDDDAVYEKYGVTPSEFIDVKALMGDTSDNIPGVSGIGEKTALEFIKKYKNIEFIYENFGDIDFKPAQKIKMESGKENAFLSKKLSTIDRNVPMDFNTELCIRKAYNFFELKQLLTKLEFKNFIKRMGLDAFEMVFDDDESSADIAEVASGNESNKTDIFVGLTEVYLSTEDEINQAVKLLLCEKEVVYRSYYDDVILCAIGFLMGNKAYYCPTAQLSGISDITIAQAFKPFFEEKNIVKISHDVKTDIVNLYNYGIEFSNMGFDTMIGAYILQPSISNFDIATLCDKFMDIDVLATIQEFLGKGKSFTPICHKDENEAKAFVGRELVGVLALKEYITGVIKENNQENLCYNIEFPLIDVLAQMEIVGFYVNREKLDKFGGELTVKLNSLTVEIYHLSKEEFNINSPKQLGVVLFEKLGLKCGKKTKSGYSTDIDVLMGLRDEHEIIEKVIEFRQLSKLKSTYCDGLAAVISTKTNRIHSKFNQYITVTGRISSTEPNLQNIPVRMELGRKIRDVFGVQSEEFLLLDADYSQIELRVLAHIAKDKTMIDAFLSDTDIHAVTASQVFGVDLEQVSSAMRSSAKAVNFGIVYGIGEYSLAQDIGVPVREAKTYINNYLAKYSGVFEYMKAIKQKAREDGFVETMFNRRRYIPELRAQNKNIQSFGERVALNTPIQGSAADIIKIAMINVHNALKKGNFKSKLLLQVHDELIIEVHKSELEEIKVILKENMENAAKLDVPLKVDMNVGKTWFEAK